MTDLFTPVRLGRYALRNRIVMAPMTRDRSPGAVPTELVRTYYAQRATAGLIVTEGIAPEPMGHGYVDSPGLYTDAQVRAWQRVTDAVHARGGRIFAQLMHVGRISHPALLDGRTPVAPSTVGGADHVVPLALEAGEISNIVAGFARAARNAVRAGFDGVEIHGANGYLPHQFLATNVNLRGDEWRGSIEKRARFLIEVAAAAAAAIGADRVGVRISPGNGYNDIVEADAAATYAYLLDRLDALGLAYLHVYDTRPGFDVAELVLGHYRGRLILNGGYDKAGAEADLAEGRADLIAFGTAFIANPDLPARLASGAPLAEADRATFYSSGARGYTDYPALAGTLAEAA
ncbi:MAG TPA: alkene reductase [Allosphingosinicella sp.]